VSGDARSFSSFGLYVGSDSRVNCHHYGNKNPILAISAGGCSVSIAPEGRDATDSAVEFARELARKAQEFADEVERLHTARQDGTDDTKADEGTAA
jgi:hypothetical protein